MVEAMFERSPGYFKQFRKAFKFSVCDEKPELDGVKKFAVFVHFENPFCFLKTNHYHVLVDTSDETNSSDKSKFKKKLYFDLSLHDIQDFVCQFKYHRAE